MQLLQAKAFPDGKDQRAENQYALFAKANPVVARQTIVGTLPESIAASSTNPKKSRWPGEAPTRRGMHSLHHQRPNHRQSLQRETVPASTTAAQYLKS